MKHHLKLILKSYVLGVMTAGYIVLFLALLDFITSDYIKCPTFYNFIYACSISGIFFGLFWYLLARIF